MTTELPAPPRRPASEIPFAPDLPPVEPVLRFDPVEAFAAVVEPGAEPLVRATAGGVAIAAESLALIYGTGGAGKTTVVVDLCFAIAAGRSWVGILEPVRPLIVGLIENEGPRPMMRGKLRDKLASSPAVDGRIVVLAEPWSRFTFRDAEQREALARAIDDARIDLLVVGPLSRVGMEGGGTLDDVGAFEQLLNDLRDATSRPFSILIVHHESKSGAVSGAWEGVPDTLIHVQGQGHGRTRIYWQKARWSSELHGTSTHLVWAEGETFTVEEREQATDDTIAEALLAAALANGGASWNQLEAPIKGNDQAKRRVRDALIRDGLLVNVGKGRGFVLWHPADPVRPTSDAPADAPVLPGCEGGFVPGASVRPYVVEDAPGTDAPPASENGHVDLDADERDQLVPFPLAAWEDAQELA